MVRSTLISIVWYMAVLRRARRVEIGKEQPVCQIQTFRFFPESAGQGCESPDVAVGPEAHVLTPFRVGDIIKYRLASHTNLGSGTRGKSCSGDSSMVRNRRTLCGTGVSLGLVLTIWLCNSAPVGAQSEGIFITI